jgi:hypothetical protein
MIRTRLKDGRWVPAQPIPMYKDSRGYFLRLYHCIWIGVKMLEALIRIRPLENVLDEWEIKLDTYMVPMEPPYDTQKSS